MLGIIVVSLTLSVPARAELNFDINLTLPPYSLFPQAQWDYHWGGFSIGPRKHRGEPRTTNQHGALRMPHHLALDCRRGPEWRWFAVFRPSPVQLRGLYNGFLPLPKVRR
ncbi:MAG: hypothetical protein WKF84_02085 [Pyrinomonadaceae bacterium]